ncbi:MAG: phage antirepressor protein [Candidatus Magasanikbacteria bacterium RIFOXYD2_FULL_41_14]|uniref:Phage antirepressor protein n=1 Tax=Candidatus Magasanikbacteria bacterium RIFOXYD2_FULL_41_14 TaxID=1798709 RepID=A0A1F6PCN2_9BACT|nr:MAG: phage antirepressor protein [Candidatus Magasanikbacteria bacterium RIFOXYD2_FULL_41_14]
MEDTKIAIFKKKEIRKVLFNKEWWFSVIDVVGALTDTDRPSAYWTAMKARTNSDEGVELSTICRQLKLKSSDGKFYETDCANTEGIFRIIQSIPSPKAEPFKRWLAKVGYERVQEIEDPELGQKRTRMLYKLKGYPDAWIEKRMRGIDIREILTDEWNKHEVKLQKEYEILTAEIANATFGVTPSKHKKIKGLKRENLRDHMSNLELIFSMLGEAATTEIVKTEHPLGFDDNKKVAKRGGGVAGLARSQMEIETGKKVVSKDNFLPLLKGKKRLK